MVATAPTVMLIKMGQVDKAEAEVEAALNLNSVKAAEVLD